MNIANVIVQQQKQEEMPIVASAKEYIAATQRNKQNLLYFSRMAQQQVFHKRNCCRALTKCKL